MNLKIREFKQSIINFANASDLPIEVKSMALAEISRQAELMANEQIKKEIAERNKKESEVKEDGLHESSQPDKLGKQSKRSNTAK